MLDKEGAAGPGDVAIVGDEADGRSRQSAAIRDGGATDFVAVPFGERDENARTLEVFRR